jgi:hypothetical protein
MMFRLIISEPIIFLTYKKTYVYDATGNNNNRLDPGENATLTVTF